MTPLDKINRQLKEWRKSPPTIEAQAKLERMLEIATKALAFYAKTCEQVENQIFDLNLQNRVPCVAPDKAEESLADIAKVIEEG